MAPTAFERFLEANEAAKQRIGIAAENPWIDSPFEWLRSIPSSRRKGKAGELLAEAWLEGLGYRVERPRGVGHDRVVAGRRVEIKFSTLWEAGNYVFQQLRDQDYEFVFLLGISPRGAYVWIVPKAVAWAHSTPQHGGAQGSDTRWISLDPTNPPRWLHEYGGELERATEALRRLLR